MSRADRIALLLSLIAVIATYWVVVRVFESMAHIEDEVAYVWQAQAIARGHLTLPSPPHEKSFLVPFVVDHNGQRFGKYPLAVGLSILWRALSRRGAGFPEAACCEGSPTAGLPGLETPEVEPKADGVQAVDQAAPPAGLDTDRYIRAAALLGGVKRRSASRDFRGGDATAVLGGCEIDLREATIASGEAVLDVFALWGGIDVRVPPDWAVVLRGMPVLGAIEDQTTATGVPKRATLVIKGVAIMGGVGVKN